jgi:quercetin dioxygenase-like cupin family protein
VCRTQSLRVYHDGFASRFRYNEKVSWTTIATLAVYFESRQKKRGIIMSTMQTKSLNAPDETRTLPKTSIEVISFDDLSLMKLTFQPGWRWSEHVKPTAGTDSCEVPHFNYGISGRLHVRMDDGTESEIGPGDAQLLPPGHDAWVVGDEPYVGLDFQGGHLYGTPSH